MNSNELNELLAEEGRLARRKDMSASRQSETRRAAQQLLADRLQTSPDGSAPPVWVFRPVPVLAAAAALVVGALVALYVSTRQSSTDASVAIDETVPPVEATVAAVPFTLTPVWDVRDGPLIPMAWPPPPPWGDLDISRSHDSLSQSVDTFRRRYRSESANDFEARSSDLKGRIKNATRDLQHEIEGDPRREQGRLHRFDIVDGLVNT